MERCRLPRAADAIPWRRAAFLPGYRSLLPAIPPLVLERPAHGYASSRPLHNIHDAFNISCLYKFRSISLFRPDIY